MIKFFVEGNEDKNFISSYIQFLSLSERITLPAFTIETINGWTNLSKVSNSLRENADANGVNLVVFDADDVKRGGGYHLRSQQIEEIKVENLIDFELFLFPNNSDDGDFEFLLEKIVNPNHQRLLECFYKYERCISEFKMHDENLYQLPIRKAKIYSYVDAFPKTIAQNEKFKKGDYFFDSNTMWDLESDYLHPLKDFLMVNLIRQ